MDEKEDGGKKGERRERGREEKIQWQRNRYFDVEAFPQTKVYQHALRRDRRLGQLWSATRIPPSSLSPPPLSSPPSPSDPLFPPHSSPSSSFPLPLPSSLPVFLLIALFLVRTSIWVALDSPRGFLKVRGSLKILWTLFLALSFLSSSESSLKSHRNINFHFKFWEIFLKLLSPIFLSFLHIPGKMPLIGKRVIS